jgi:acetyl-CoA C-acetyltransferase
MTSSRASGISFARMRLTGARIMTTLLNNLDAVDGTLGLESMCVAGGMGQAMIVERLN